jgi:hypothetical protein
MILFIKDLQAKHGKTVKYIPHDNADKNKALEKACLQVGLGKQFEWHTTTKWLFQMQVCNATCEGLCNAEPCRLAYYILEEWTLG